MNTLIAKLRNKQNDQGSIVLWAVIGAFALLLALGLVVDGGGKLHAKQQAQLVAEEAARAAGQAVITPLAARGTAVVVNPANRHDRSAKVPQRNRHQRRSRPHRPQHPPDHHDSPLHTEVLGLIGLGEQTVVGTAHVNLNRTNTGAGAIGAP